MPQPVRRKLNDQVLVQLIEADVDIGFGLVDEVRSYRASGQPEFSQRALQNAADILTDIDTRLHQLGDSQSGPFLALVAELRNEIAAVEKEAA